MKRKLLQKVQTILILCTLQAFSSYSNAQTWIQKQNYPVAAGADGGICFSINDKIYAGGGVGSKQFREYDPSTDAWTVKANLPGVTSDRSFATAFSINGKGYVGLGLDGSTPKNDLWEYDPATNSWSQKQSFPGQARDGLYCFVIDSIAYMGAGEDPFTFQIFNAAYSYSPGTNSWTHLSDFPTSGVIYPFSFSIGNKGFVSCGQNFAAATNLTFEYNPSGDDWSPGATFTGANRQAGVSFVIGSKVYCGLGMDSGFYNDFYSYDTLTGFWSISDSLPALGRSFAIAAVVNNTAYAGLGWSFSASETLYHDWWEFSTSTDIKDVNENKIPISIFPNPASKKINIFFECNQKFFFKITNAIGEIILSGDLSNNISNAIDISNFTNGIYCILIYNDTFLESKLFFKN
jgi:N-acetylneuraminic acid mutarotase